MSCIPKELSHRSQKLARSILDMEAHDHLLKHGRPMPMPKDPVGYLLRWIVAHTGSVKLPRDYDGLNERLGQREGVSSRGTTYSGMLKATEKFGFEVLGRFASFIDGEAITILGRDVDLVMFVATSSGGILTNVSYLGEIDTLPDSGPNRFDIGNGLNMFLELDALFAATRLAAFSDSPRAFLKNFEVKLVTPREVHAFYRGRAADLTVVSSDLGNLSSFGRGRLKALPERWRDRIAAGSS